MMIRRAEERDIAGILSLLSQVLEVHAAIRPDLFIPGRTKYTDSELKTMVKEDSNPIYVAMEGERVAGYAFCMTQNAPATNCTYGERVLYIDDICVDEKMRKRGIAGALFSHVKQEAKKGGFDRLTLNVWEGNDAARRFYENAGMKPRKTVMECTVE